MGSLAVHIAAKLPVTQRALTRPLADGAEQPERFGADPSGRTRRGFLSGVGCVAASGVVVLSVGQTLRPLRVRSPSCRARRPGVGPAGTADQPHCVRRGRGQDGDRPGLGSSSSSDPMARNGSRGTS